MVVGPAQSAAKASTRASTGNSVYDEDSRQGITPLSQSPSDSVTVINDSKPAIRDVEDQGKPAMPRAKRVISFDDQTSRLSRSKLVIVYASTTSLLYLLISYIDAVLSLMQIPRTVFHHLPQSGRSSNGSHRRTCNRQGTRSR